MDYTNPAAVKWYQEQLQGAIDLGFHGWMYDYGEYTPPDSISSDGTVGAWGRLSTHIQSASLVLSCTLCVCGEQLQPLCVRVLMSHM